MTTIQFKVTLLSDVILNQKSASTSNNTTLDFIPGSCFLGIAASSLYKNGANAKTLELFHSGNVRWGDAHLGTNGNRGNKVPASLFYPKLKKASEKLYIHHFTDTDDKEIRKKQLKQCRAGFYDFTQETPVKIEAETTFAIKSARDKESRTSKDSTMFGYEALCKGAELYFEVETDNDGYRDEIVKALEGERRVGRSRTAQYGLVKIEQCSYSQVESQAAVNGTVIVYADSRLVFFDPETGVPTFQPTSEQLGVTGGEINWEKSQVRTFQYAPWNFKRQCFDTDRCCVEKGSVFVIEGATSCPETTTYVGAYRNEGLGRVIYNPAFLATTTDGGKACYTLGDGKKDDSVNYVGPSACNAASSPLLRYLNAQHAQQELNNKIYKDVNDFVGKNKGNFTGEFASQWGTIRALASDLDNGNILDVLFKDDKDDHEHGAGKEKSAKGYLMHGVGEEKWRDRNRRDLLQKFINKFNSDAEQRLALINLASQMAKAFRKEGKK